MWKIKLPSISVRIGNNLLQNRCTAAFRRRFRQYTAHQTHHALNRLHIVNRFSWQKKKNLLFNGTGANLHARARIINTCRALTRTANEQWTRPLLLTSKICWKNKITITLFNTKKNMAHKTKLFFFPISKFNKRMLMTGVRATYWEKKNYIRSSSS